MSAEILRRAAAGLRNDATEISDRTVVDNRVNGVWLNSAYYLTTTPDFLLAVADVLHMAADHLEGRGNPCDSCVAQALTVARLFLGEAADD